MPTLSFRSLSSDVKVLVPSLMLSALMVGCGSSKEVEEGEEYGLSSVGRLEYSIDSLANENRRLRQQIEAVSIENRNLTARVAELNVRLAEAPAVPFPTEVTPPPTPKETKVLPKSTDIMVRYNSAVAEYRKRNFPAASAQFQSMLDDGIREDLADNCHYWIGESQYGMGKYQAAIDHFAHVIGYKHTEKRDDAQMMIGNCYLALGNKTAAREAFNKLIATYPASPFVRRAQERLDHMK